MKKNLILLLLIITAYSLLCITKHQYFRLTADSMLYFSIAHKYLAGDFQNAINGYWGPLLSWSLIPFLYLGASDVTAINLLNLVIGVLTLVGAWKLSERLEITGVIKGVVLICMLPIVLRFSLVQPMDFLLVCILIFYLSTVFNIDYPKRLGSGLLSGLLGSLAYFTKAYAFPFFIVHFLFMNIFHYFRNTGKEGRRRVLKNAVAGLVLFTLISGTWIMLISDKYGHMTFSTMRDTNFNAPGPEDMGGGLEFGVPVFSEGFFEPTNDTAFVIWEDPSYLRGKPWSAWQSFDHFKHFVRLTLKNVSDGLKILESFSTLSIAIIIAYFLLLLGKPGKKYLSNGILLYPLFTLILFSGGYLLFHFEERYVWLSNFLLLVMGCHVLSILFQGNFLKSELQKNVLLFLFVLSFIFVPSKFIMQVGRGGMDTDMYYMSNDLKKYNIKGNVASNREQDSHDAWHKTFRLAYWLDIRYYGQAAVGISDEDLVGELKKYAIDYYFFWGEDKNPPFLEGYKKVTNKEIPGLDIFSLKELLPASYERRFN